MTRRILLDFLCCAIVTTVIFLAACGDNEQLPERDYTGSSMGTSYSVRIVNPPESVDQGALQEQIEVVLMTVEHTMSTYMSDSDVMAFNISRSTDWLETSAELCTAIADAQLISTLTDGAFDITVGPLVNLWGFGPEGPVAGPPDNQDIEHMLRNVGYQHLETDCTVPALRKHLPDLYVDLSAYAKGYAVDKLAMLLDDKNITNYLVEIGGELRMRGTNSRNAKWSIAIERPSALARNVQTVIELTDTGLATSGDYRNFFEHDGVRYSHTIDPQTGSPVEHSAASVTVVASSTAFADALATALLVLGPDEGLRFAEREQISAYFLIRSADDIDEQLTSGFEMVISE